MPHCLEPGTLKKVIDKSFDGQNWEKSMEQEQDKSNSILKFSNE